jgi:hypothetical protein
VKTYTRRILQVALCAALAHSLATAADDDDKADDKVPESAQAPAMTAEQRHAVGIAVAHPLAAHIPDRIESLGLVLDTTALVSDIGDMTAAGVAERSTKAEVTRLHGLYEGGAGASVKMLEAAQAEQAKAVAQSRFAVARFSQHWGPLATMPAAKRGQLLEAVLRGRSLLLRADVPGRHSLGSLPDTAELDVDGISVPGRVLGLMQHTDDTQSVGLLIGVEHAPAGLGPGAHVPVALIMAKRSGLLLPRDAVLYDERGAYVFKQLTGKADEKVRYTRLSVTLLVGHGNDWLVDGVDNDDEIVVEGAGVLWSLEGMGGRVVDSDDDN